MAEQSLTISASAAASKRLRQMRHQQFNEDDQGTRDALAALKSQMALSQGLLLLLFLASGPSWGYWLGLMRSGARQTVHGARTGLRLMLRPVCQLCR